MPDFFQPKKNQTEIFRDKLLPLPPKDCATVCKDLIDQSPLPNNTIKTTGDLQVVLSMLSAEQCEAVCQALKDQLPNLIKTANDFENAFRDFFPVQRTAIFEVLKDQLPGLIKTADDFQNVLRYLPSEQCEAVCQALEDQLPNLIKTANDFENAFRYLSPVQRTAVFEALKDKLLNNNNFIKTAKDLKIVLFYLSPEHCTIVCRALIDRFCELVKETQDLQDVLFALLPEQRIAVFEVFKDQLINLIKTADDLKEVDKSFTTDNKKIFKTYVTEQAIKRFTECVKIANISYWKKDGVLTLEEIRNFIKQDQGRNGFFRSSHAQDCQATRDLLNNGAILLKIEDDFNLIVWLLKLEPKSIVASRPCQNR